MVVHDLDQPATQDQFGQLVGISQQAVSALVGRGVLTEGASFRAWLLEYTGNLRAKASGNLRDKRLVAARVEEADASARLKHLQFSDRVSQLVEVAGIEPTLRDWAAFAQRQVILAAAEINARLRERYASLGIEPALVDDAIASALRDIAAIPAVSADGAVDPQTQGGSNEDPAAETV